MGEGTVYPDEITDEELAQLAPTDPVAIRLFARVRRVEMLLKATTNDVARRHGMAMEQKSRADKASEELEHFKREAAELRADVSAAERYSRGLNNTVETKNAVNASLRVELTELRSKYDELKLHLEMYKDQWKRNWEARKAELETETALVQSNWFAEHLNHEVDDIRADRDSVVAECARMRKALHRVVEYCSYTRDSQDPLATVGLMANDALALSEAVDEG